MGWPCFRSLLSFAGFSFSSSFESKHEKQPIPPNQIKKRFFFFFSLQKKKKNTDVSKLNLPVHIPIQLSPKSPSQFTTHPKFWVSLSLSPISLGTTTRDWQKKKMSNEKRQSERIQVSRNTTNNDNKEKQIAKKK